MRCRREGSASYRGCVLLAGLRRVATPGEGRTARGTASNAQVAGLQRALRPSVLPSARGTARQVHRGAALHGFGGVTVGRGENVPSPGARCTDAQPRATSRELADTCRVCKAPRQVAKATKDDDGQQPSGPALQLDQIELALVLPYNVSKFRTLARASDWGEDGSISFSVLPKAKGSHFVSFRADRVQRASDKGRARTDVLVRAFYMLQPRHAPPTEYEALRKRGFTVEWLEGALEKLVGDRLTLVKCDAVTSERFSTTLPVAAPAVSLGGTFLEPVGVEYRAPTGKTANGLRRFRWTEEPDETVLHLEYIVHALKPRAWRREEDRCRTYLQQILQR